MRKMKGTKKKKTESLVYRLEQKRRIKIKHTISQRYTLLHDDTIHINSVCSAIFFFFFLLPRTKSQKRAS